MPRYTVAQDVDQGCCAASDQLDLSPTFCGETVDGDGSLGFLVLAFQSVTSEESPDNDKELKPSSSQPALPGSSTGMPSKFLMIFFTLSPGLPGSSSVSRRGSGAPLLLSAAGVVHPYCCGSGCQAGTAEVGDHP